MLLVWGGLLDGWRCLRIDGRVPAVLGVVPGRAAALIDHVFERFLYLGCVCNFGFLLDVYGPRFSVEHELDER